MQVCYGGIRGGLNRHIEKPCADHSRRENSMPILFVLPWCFLAMFLSVLPLRAIPLSSNSPVTLYFALYRILHPCPISVHTQHHKINSRAILWACMILLLQVYINISVSIIIIILLYYYLYLILIIYGNTKKEGRNNPAPSGSICYDVLLYDILRPPLLQINYNTKQALFRRVSGNLEKVPIPRI